MTANISDHKHTDLDPEAETSSAISKEVTTSSTSSHQTGSVDEARLNPQHGPQTQIQSSFQRKWDSFINSFRAPVDLGPDVENTGGEVQPSKNGLKSRHVLMIALAGGLGTGLLVGLGNALATAGPGACLLAYVLVGSMVFCTINSAGELAIAYSSLPGGFNAYAVKLVDPSLGFAVAWNYCINWFTVLPLEMVTASMTIKFWDQTTNPDVYVVVFLFLVCVINFVGSSGYAEAEFWANLVKVAMLVGFVVIGIFMDSGIIGTQGKIGFKYFSDPGSFNNGFKGFAAVLVTAAFSLGGAEFMALTAADQTHPRKAIPSAVKQVGYRLIGVYLLSVLLIGLLVPYNSPYLMGSGHNNGAPVSPFVIAINSGSIQVIPHIFNAVILIAVLSVGNSALYSSSRTFYSLAQHGYAPKWFDFVDKQGRPSRAIAVSSILGLFSLIAAYPNQEDIFVWLLSLSGLASLFTWSMINISHIRFRAAMGSQGLSTENLGYKSWTGVPGSWLGLLVNIFILGCQFWVSLFPFSNDGKPSVKNFFQNYLGFPVLVIFYLAHKILTKNWRFIIPANEIDLDTDRKIFSADLLRQEVQEEKNRLNNGPIYKKVISFWC
jgi:amino acid transporter